MQFAEARVVGTDLLAAAAETIRRLDSALDDIAASRPL